MSKRIKCCLNCANLNKGPKCAERKSEELMKGNFQECSYWIYREYDSEDFEYDFLSNEYLKALKFSNYPYIIERVGDKDCNWELPANFNEAKDKIRDLAKENIGVVYRCYDVNKNKKLLITVYHDGEVFVEII